MRKLLFFLPLILLAKFSISQQDISLKNILPPSPEATAFVKYGTYPIGTYTGKPDISIPIYEINTAKLSLPISLSYDATGIRINDMSTWVGMNWTLDAGGMISQVVIGEPDCLLTDWNCVPPRGNEIVNNTAYFNYMKALAEGEGSQVDADPDKFYFSFNGRSGSFVFDRNRNIMQIPKTSLKIEVIGALMGFKITDENGTTYIFSIQETTESFIYSRAGQYPDAKNNSGSSSYKNQKSSYYLSEIISSDGFDHFYLSYDNDITVTKDETYTETAGPKYNNGNQFPTDPFKEYRWSASNRVITVPRIKTIAFANGKVEFTRVSGRMDDAGGMSSSRLDEISIYQKNSNGNFIKLKSFQFVQDYYYNGTDSFAQNSGLPNQISDRYRLRLDEIKLKDASGFVVSKYAFFYNSINLPPKTSYAQDWWGYYNGEISNSTLVPTTIANTSPAISIGGANRNANESYMKAGILEKIIYPTGGYTIFETESHKQYIQDSLVGEGYNANALGMSSNNLVVQNFTADSRAQANSGKLNITIGPYGANDVQPFVMIKNLTTGQEQIFVSPDRTNFYNYNTSYEIIPNNDYQLTASCYSGQSYAMAYINVAFNKLISNPHVEAVGGLRIKTIKNYYLDNTLANEEHYKYGAGESGTGVFTTPGIYTNSYGRDQRVYQGASLNCRILVGGVYNVFMGGPLYDQGLVQGSPVVYTDVVKYYGNPTANSGKTTYYYGPANEHWLETRPLPTGHELANNQGILIINDAWKKGRLKLQQEYRRNVDGSYTKIQETENIYNTIYTDTAFGLMAQLRYDRIVLPGSDLCLWKYLYDYNWADYPIYSGFVQLLESRKKVFSANGSNSESVINYTYDNTLKDIETKTTTVNSKGETIETEKKFPFHKAQLISSVTPSESSAIDSMMKKNILIPIEIISRKNNIQLQLEKTSYEYVNAATIAPVNIKFQNGSNAVETRLQFSKYNSFGNLVEQQKTNDVKEVYLWGYRSQYPVAKITNTTYDIAQTYITQGVLDNPSDDVSLRSHLANLRNIPGAMVTTYTYKPLVGTTSETDPNGRTNYFEYDGYTRLNLIRDQDNNIIKKFCYNYSGLLEDCFVTVYNSVSKSAVFTRNNCASGTGTSVTYTVPAGTYTSTVSQADADQLAQNDVNNNGQAYANSYGICNCIFTMSSGFSSPYSTVVATGNTISFNLVFYPSSSMNIGTEYMVSTVSSGCAPSSERTMTFNYQGRSYMVTIYGSSGIMGVRPLNGSNIDAYNTINLVGNYIKSN